MVDNFSEEVENVAEWKEPTFSSNLLEVKVL